MHMTAAMYTRTCTQASKLSFLLLYIQYMKRLFIHVTA